MKKEKRIIYKIEIYCEVNKNGVVIPDGESISIADAKGKPLNMLNYPSSVTISIIWLGKYLQYPLVKNKIDRF